MKCRVRGGQVFDRRRLVGLWLGDLERIFRDLHLGRRVKCCRHIGKDRGLPLIGRNLIGEAKSDNAGGNGAVGLHVHRPSRATGAVIANDSCGCRSGERMFGIHRQRAICGILLDFLIRHRVFSATAPPALSFGMIANSRIVGITYLSMPTIRRKKTSDTHRLWTPIPFVEIYGTDSGHAASAGFVAG